MQTPVTHKLPGVSTLACLCPGFEAQQVVEVPGHVLGKKVAEVWVTSCCPNRRPTQAQVAQGARGARGSKGTCLTMPSLSLPRTTMLLPSCVTLDFPGPSAHLLDEDAGIALLERAALGLEPTSTWL